VVAGYINVFFVVSTPVSQTNALYGCVYVSAFRSFLSLEPGRVITGKNNGEDS
jgi:hypothetical protein